MSAPTASPEPLGRLAAPLADAGGVRAPREHAARLHALLMDELARGAAELRAPRSGVGAPVVVAFAAGASDRLMAVVPVTSAVRADPDAVAERAWLLVAAAVAAAVEALGLRVPAGPDDLALRAGSCGGWLALGLDDGRPGDADPDVAELAALAYDEAAAAIDRLRTRALAVPPHALGEVDDLRAPIGAAHPLRIAEAVARLGGRPADAGSVAGHEDAVLALLDPPEAAVRPHEDPDPARRIARRILQRLAGMGKWGGYHTEIAHVARGFAGHDRALALEVSERLLDAGLLVAKSSVGQRHVFLNPRRAGDVHALIERGAIPPGLRLPDG